MTATHSNNLGRIGVFAALSLAAAGAGLLAMSNMPQWPAKAELKTAITERVAPDKEWVQPNRLSAEGELLASPPLVDVGLSQIVEPGVMSIVFSDEKTAWDFYHEAVQNGEQVCLSDLGPKSTLHKGQRYWLRSC